LRPLVFPHRIPVAPNLHRLLGIRGFLAKRSNLSGVSRLGNTLASNFDIASV
jgi:hypothetical protein